MRARGSGSAAGPGRPTPRVASVYVPGRRLALRYNSEIADGLSLEGLTIVGRTLGPSDTAPLEPGNLFMNLPSAQSVNALEQRICAQVCSFRRKGRPEARLDILGRLAAKPLDGLLRPSGGSLSRIHALVLPHNPDRIQKLKGFTKNRSLQDKKGLGLLVFADLLAGDVRASTVTEAAYYSGTLYENPVIRCMGGTAITPASQGTLEQIRTTDPEERLRQLVGFVIAHTRVDPVPPASQ